jgi:coatomer subunit delta
VLVSRQFVDMNRIRVEALLAAFPKLLGSGKQHTFVETENVRYVYQPMEGMYLLLITNKQSNILEDLETLRLLSKVVPEYLEVIDEAAIAETAFELLFAFDEVISLGHKEEVTVAQVRQNTDMRSFEEDLANALLAQKVEDVKSHMRAKAQEIDRTKQDQKSGTQPWRSTVTIPTDSAVAQAMSQAMEDGPSFAQPMGTSLLSKPSALRGPSKGMKLSKDKKNDIISALVKEGEKDVAAPLAGPSVTAAAASSTEPITVKIEEKLTVKMNKEGGLENMGVQGTLTVLCSDEEHAFIQLVLQAGANAGVQFNTHPNIDRALYASERKLGVRDPSKPFPVGVPQGILKWRFQTTDIDLVPITINCWPTPSGAETYINIEYEATSKFDLQNVVISIPGVLLHVAVLQSVVGQTCVWWSFKTASLSLQPSSGKDGFSGLPHRPRAQQAKGTVLHFLSHSV